MNSCKICSCNLLVKKQGWRLHFRKLEAFSFDIFRCFVPSMHAQNLRIHIPKLKAVLSTPQRIFAKLWQIIVTSPGNSWRMT